MAFFHPREMYKWGGGGLTQGADKPIRKDQHLHKSSSAFSACVSMVRVGQQVAELLTAEMVSRWIPSAIRR